MCQQRKAIYLPRSMDRGIDHMSDEQLGDVMRAVLLYDLDGTIMDFGDNVVGQVMFETLILPWMEECNAKVAHRAEYSSRGGKECQRRRKAAQARVAGRGETRVEENEEENRCQVPGASSQEITRVEGCGETRVEENVGNDRCQVPGTSPQEYEDTETEVIEEITRVAGRGLRGEETEENEGDEEYVGDEDCEEDAVEDFGDVQDVFYPAEEEVEDCAQSARVEDCGLRDEENEGNEVMMSDEERGDRDQVSGVRCQESTRVEGSGETRRDEGNGGDDGNGRGDAGEGFEARARDCGGVDAGEKELALGGGAEAEELPRDSPPAKDLKEQAAEIYHKLKNMDYPKVRYADMCIRRIMVLLKAGATEEMICRAVEHYIYTRMERGTEDQYYKQLKDLLQPAVLYDFMPERDRDCPHCRGQGYVYGPPHLGEDGQYTSERMDCECRLKRLEVKRRIKDVWCMDEGRGSRVKG